MQKKQEIRSPNFTNKGLSMVNVPRQSRPTNQPVPKPKPKAARVPKPVRYRSHPLAEPAPKRRALAPTTQATSRSQPNQHPPVSSLPPVIVHSSFVQSSLVKLLQSSYKVISKAQAIKVTLTYVLPSASDSCLPHLIFPSFASAAFLLYHLESLTTSDKRVQEAIEKAESLGSNFETCFVLIVKSSESTSWQPFTKMQLRCKDGRFMRIHTHLALVARVRNR